MDKMMIKNWISNLLAPAMKENGCPSEVRTQEDVMNNLYYLSKEDGRGSRYIPLQYKRMIEKIVFGLFNTSFEYSDKEDVYFEKIGDTLVCCANVYLVSFAEDGTKKVLGHGFHCLSLDEVMPGIFMSESERASKWKSTVIGGAKSRALYDAGIGLEFYGDVFTPEINLDENELPKEEKAAPKTSEKKEEKKYSESGMPIPKPKKVIKESEPVKNDKEPELPVVETKPEAVADTSKTEDMSIEIARAISADCGNYAGMSLGDIYETAPKNLVFLVRNSKDENVRKAAKVIVCSDPELSEKFAV
ncbi:MAG: hypothetical protein J6M44_00580 [Butyrivibrio sp.]|nr:hypothetical protein [Butyrivibrio sp.]